MSYHLAWPLNATVSKAIGHGSHDAYNQMTEMHSNNYTNK